MSAHLLTRVGTERFAFPLEQVVEALDAPGLHDLPRRPAGMLGTLRHRGRTLPVWDAESTFGVGRDGGLGTALVFQDGARGVALLVDDAEDILQIDDGAVRDAPAGADGGGLLSGVYQNQGTLVNVVRVNVLVARLVSQGERSNA
ncbi:MAG: chemotaxis protein CheW [Gemmatimonadaceae bacterium]